MHPPRACSILPLPDLMESPLSRSPKAGPKPQERFSGTHCLITALLAFLLYLPTTAYEFTFDDSVLVARNEAVQEPGQWRSIFLSDYWPGSASALYRPLTILSFALERLIHGSGPAGFHWTNVLLHSGVSVLVYLLAVTMLGPGWPALLAGCLFAAHPLHTEVVCGIAGRAELLSSLGALGALWIWLSRPARSRLVPMCLACSLFLLGLGSKENVMVLPALILLWEMARGGGRTPLRRGAALAVSPGFWALLVVAGAFLVVRMGVLGGWSSSLDAAAPFVENPLAHESAPIRVLNAVANQTRGLTLHAFPYPLIADYSYKTLPQRSSWLSPSFVLMVGFVAAVLALWFCRSRHARMAAFSLSWYLTAILPAGNMLFPIGTIFGERLYYFPSAGLSLAVGACAAWIAEKSMRSGQTDWRRWFLPAAGAALVFALAGVTLIHSPVWQSDLALFQDTVRKAPENAKARLWLGDALVRSGRHEEGLLEYRKALEIYPRYAAPAMNMLVPLNVMKRYREAAEAGEEARHITGSDNPVLLHNLALAYLGTGDSIRFLDCMNRILQMDPENSGAHMQLGKYYLQYTSDIALARRHLEEALRLAPNSPDAAALRTLLSKIR